MIDGGRNRRPGDAAVAPAARPAAAAGAWHGPAGYRGIIAVAIFCALAFSATPAMAEFTVCNQTLDVVNVALGEEVNGQFQTDGWWTIGANRCVDVIRDELASRYVYIYATDVFGNAVLKGTTEMCVDRRHFTIRGIRDCWQRGYITARFHEVDTLDQVRWTMFLRRSGP